MKPGQLVMLVKQNDNIPTGAFGEIVDPARWTSYVPVGEVVVDFPKFPSNTISKYWRCPATWLVPINDPDADVSDTTGTPVKEQIKVTYE